MAGPPHSRRDDTLDLLHGRPIADPYRWLEDPDAADTVEWVDRQNAYSRERLESLPEREWFAATMRAVVGRPRAGVPRKRGGRYVVSRNDGRQDQDVVYVADSLGELLEGGRVLIDPNTFSRDGTRALDSLNVSPDGRLAAYGVSDGGSDWATFHLLDAGNGEAVEDALIQTKFSEAVWLPDGRSYLYCDFPHEGHVDGTQTGALGGVRLRRHRVGDPQDLDELVLSFPENDRLMCWAEVTDDDAYAVVSIVEGTEARNRLWLYPLSRDEQGASVLGEPVKVVDEPTAEVGLVRSRGTTLFLRTDDGAERGRVVAVDLAGEAGAGGRHVTEVIAEQPDTLLHVAAAGDELVAVYLCDAAPRLVRFDLDGRRLGEIDVTGGAVTAVNGKPGDPELFVGLSTVTTPTASYRVELPAGTVTPLPELVAGDGSYVPPEVVVERRAATSRDGTAVPYFLIFGRHTDLSRPQPTLMWGYGGFRVSELADYRAGWPAWLAAGGVLVMANLRGGGEFGAQWHEAGRLSNKQNVFDDFVAVGEHLKESGVTTTGQLAMYGRSNGGLLVGAVLTQRPDLVAAAIPGVGVLDMLRFHRFTVGAAWMSDYGNPDDPDQFEDLLAYSPLHNVAVGTAYPATLVLTGDHDDRVVPLHSHKFTATLQHAQAGDQPVLTRIEVATGHGAGKPASLVAAEWADLLAFAAHHTGLTVP